MSRIGPTVAALLMAMAFIVAPAGAATAITSADGFACAVAYKANQHQGDFIIEPRFTAELTVTNTGTVTINGWTLTFPMDQGVEIIKMWGAMPESRRGLITAHNVPENRVVEPGRSVDVEFLARGIAGRPPEEFTVNGVRCTVAR